MKEQTLGLIRHALTFIGGVVVAKGLVDESLLQEVIGAAMTILGAAWSVLSKKA